jgi:hypothetical protein
MDLAQSRLVSFAGHAVVRGSNWATSATSRDYALLNNLSSAIVLVA